MMHEVMTLYEVLLIYYLKTNSAANRNLARAINKSKDSSKYFYRLVGSYIFSHDNMSYQYDLK